MLIFPVLLLLAPSLCFLLRSLRTVFCFPLGFLFAFVVFVSLICMWWPNIANNEKYKIQSFDYSNEPVSLIILLCRRQAVALNAASLSFFLFFYSRSAFKRQIDSVRRLHLFNCAAVVWGWGYVCVCDMGFRVRVYVACFSKAIKQQQKLQRNDGHGRQHHQNRPSNAKNSLE